jgi:DNA-binding MarR family transcriptional regulator
MLAHDVNRLMNLFPMIFHACRTRYLTDQKSGVRLTANQLNILDHLDRRSPTNLQTLAIELGVTPPTMSLAIDRLTMLNFVTRQKDEKDRRKTNLTLTDAGEAVKGSRTILDRNLVERLLSGMREDTRDQALAGLQALARAAESMLTLRAIERPWNRNLNE